MNKIKHSKYKNTAILYETLVKQLMYDSMQDRDSKAMGIIKKYFNKNTELYKELKLYQSLHESNFNNDSKAMYFVDKMIAARKRLSSKSLRSEKYNLVKEIKENYNIDHFFKSSIKDYKEWASIYQLFEYDEYDYPVEINKCKMTLCESIVNKPASVEETTHPSVAEFAKLDPEIRSLSYKLMVDSFNENYSGLSKPQKEILRAYITNTNGQELLEYFKKSAMGVKKKLDIIAKDDTIDEVISIKAEETAKLLCRYKDLRMVNENDIYVLMKYHDLITEINKLRRIK